MLKEAAEAVFVCDILCLVLELKVGKRFWKKELLRATASTAERLGSWSSRRESNSRNWQQQQLGS